MRSRNWFFGPGIVVGAGASYALFQLVQIFLLFAGDVAPRLTGRWTLAIHVAGGLASGLFGLVALLFIARATNGPGLLRRMGVSVGALGLTVAIAGIVFFLMPDKPPVHPGRIAGGDIAAGTIAYLVFLSGIVLAVAAILFVIGGIGWSWMRRKRQVRV